MQWQSWASFWRPEPSRDDDKKEQLRPKDSLVTSPSSQPSSSGTWNTNLNSTDWSHYTTTQTITISLVTTATTLALIKVYKTYLRRIPSVEHLKPGFLRNRSFYGIVTRVGDGDNFHLFHTPGGRWMGWGWLPGRRVKEWKGKQLKDKTMHVRLAGVDAPELAHFGKPAQPYGQEAIDWLKSFVLHKYVRVYPYREDQYKRVVCSAYRRRWLFFRSDVGLNMLKRGLATVYEAKFGSEFGNKEEEYRAAEQKAKARRVGMWNEPGLVGKMLGRKSSFESPREYKTRTAKEDKVGKEKEGKKADMAK